MKISEDSLEKTKKELLHIKSFLTKKINGNLNFIRSKHDASGNDFVDISLDDIEDSLCMSLSGKEREIIAKIDRALEKIEEGSYGICDISGKEISLQRLNVMPYATMTVESQREIEKMHHQ